MELISEEGVVIDSNQVQSIQVLNDCKDEPRYRVEFLNPDKSLGTAVFPNSIILDIAYMKCQVRWHKEQITNYEEMVKEYTEALNSPKVSVEHKGKIREYRWFNEIMIRDNVRIFAPSKKLIAKVEEALKEETNGCK